VNSTDIYCVIIKNKINHINIINKIKHIICEFKGYVGLLCINGYVGWCVML
jgi:hypothetical protein